MSLLLEKLDWIPPEEELIRWREEPWLALLDSGGNVGRRSRWSVFCVQPRRTFAGNDADAWEQLRASLPRQTPHHPLPFVGGVIGLASYQAGLQLANIASRHTAHSDALTFASYDGAFLFDRAKQQRFWASYCGAPPPRLVAGSARIKSALTQVKFCVDFDRLFWGKAVRDVIECINAGDIFQANLTSRWHAPALPEDIDPIDLYLRLRATSPAPFGGFFKSPRLTLLSASIERFIRLDAGGAIETRPIKGTAPVGETRQENIALAEALRHNEKEYAENLMITDLMRNDIGRVCDIGSVDVPSLCVVERFKHVHHLISSVRGQLKQGVDAVDLLQATLPPGSVTGAPKHQAIRVIDTIERSHRNAYCGSLFYMSADGSFDSNVVIRSVCISNESLSIGAGGGITTLSDPDREYDEMLLKVKPLVSLFQG